MNSSIETSCHIVADIGGTNARFACVHVGQQDLHAIEKFPCADFPLFIDAVQAYMRSLTAPVDGVCLAVAGPVEQDWIDLPNNHWAFSRRELEQELSLPVTVINDFSAQVLSIAALADKELQWIGEPRPPREPGGITAVLGPGTGLGVAAMMPGGDIVPSEGRELPAPGVTAGARAGDDLCRQAVTDFSEILGAVAGDFALALGAYRGVYLSGGILPQMLDVIDVAAIRKSFENKGRFQPVCAQVPLAIVLAEHPGLVGCAQALLRS